MHFLYMKNCKKIRLYLLCNLVFYFMVVGCGDGDWCGTVSEEITVSYEDMQIKRLNIPRHLLPEFSAKSVEKQVQVRLLKPGAPDILGEFEVSDEFVVFTPLVPFRPGLEYEVIYRQQPLDTVNTSRPKGYPAPFVLAIFPTRDSLPENLLKLYIRFSWPMQEGVSAEHIKLVKDGRDTLQDVFLNLQPELWNPERTVLTLWFDPGRIKRDLQPNKLMGPPLEANTRYSIVITPGWQDTNGFAIEEAFKKDFITIRRDNASPDPDKWLIFPPGARSREFLQMDMYESLDYQLLYNSLRIVDSKGKEVPGKIFVQSNETTWRVQPAENWRAGNYTIEIESKLEDLAGNNLNRLFDTDLTQQQNKKQAKVYRKVFSVR